MKGCLEEKRMQIEMLFGGEKKGIRLRGGWGKKILKGTKRDSRLKGLLGRHQEQ